MKKMFVIVFLLLLLPLVSSAEIQIKNEFDSGETLFAKISGNFLDQPEKENIVFYRGHVKIPVVYEMEKISDEYYLYVLLTGKTEGNYSISLENVRYMSGIDISEENVVENFTITGKTADFSVNPGFINLIGNDEFEIELQNLQTSSITVNIETSERIQSSSSIILKSGEKKRITFDPISDLQDSEEISLSSENTNYAFPVFTLSNLTVVEKKEIDFNFEPDFVDASIATESDTKRIVYLVNNGEEAVQDITFLVSEILEPYVTIFPETINNLEKNSTERIEIRLISDIDEAIIEGEITAISENSSTSLTLVLNFIKDFIPLEPELEEVVATTCVQLNGNICETGYECGGDVAHVRDGVCCLAQCEETVEGSSGKVIGWLIIMVIVLAIAWFLKNKYFGVRRKIGF